MLGFFEWISDEMIPPRDAYDPAVGRPRCKKCGKDAWLMWNGKYSAYCSTDCQKGDKRKGPMRSSFNSSLPSRGFRTPVKLNALERAIAAKKAARDIKAMAEKWTAQRKKEPKEDVYSGDAPQRDVENNGENVRKSDSFAHRQAEEAEFHKMQSRLAQVAETLAKEQLRTEEEKSLPNFKPPGKTMQSGDAHVSRLHSSSLFSSEAPGVEQAFADELHRQAEEEEKKRTGEISGKVLAQTRDLLQSAQAPFCDSSSSTYVDKAIQARMQTPEESPRQGGKARNSFKSERDPEKGKRYTGSRQRRGEEDYDGNCHRTTVEATRSNLPRAEYAHLIGHVEQSTTAANDKTTSSGRRYIRRRPRSLDCTRRESEKCSRERAIVDVVYARKQPLNEKGTSNIPLIATRDDSRRRQQPRDFLSWYRHSTHTPPPPEPKLPCFVQNESHGVNTAKLDEHCLMKSHERAKKVPSILSRVPRGDVTSAAPQQNTSEALRVAGTADTYVTLDDMQQLREAAWMETKMAMEEPCACCVRDQYAGSLEVHVICAKNLNPARVSPDDRLYIRLRCQVAEKEWAEKRSESVKNLRWDESFSFPLMYEKYPLRARVCVQLWKRASYQGDVDVFVGEGEIPFPLNVTRCVLPVQLCWNTKLGGNVVDLDCGRLQVAVRLLQRMHTEDANSALMQTRAISANAKETPNESQQTTTLLQARTGLKGTQKVPVRRRKTGNTSGFRKTEARKPADCGATTKSVGDHKSNLSTERGAWTARGAADPKRRHGSASLESFQANSLGTYKSNALLSLIKTKDKENTVEQGDNESNVRVEMRRVPLRSQGVPQANIAAVRGKKYECSNIEKGGHPLGDKVQVTEDTEPAEREEKQDLIARTAPVSAKALLQSKTTHSGAEISTEATLIQSSLGFPDNLASSSATAGTSTVNSRICGVELQEPVSNTAVSFVEKRRTISDSRPGFQGPVMESVLPLSVVPHNEISEAELQVLLPVALAQMDDFSHFDAEPGCVAPAANLDPCVLVQPWCRRREKWTHCANKSCRRIISNRFMNDLFEEEEFRAWGCCSICQGEMFHTEVSSSTNGVIQVSADSGMYDEFRLESLIPLAFPTLSVIWPSSRHLYVAQRFTYVQIQERLRQCRTQRELTFILMAPLLKYFVRSDWSSYRHVALRTCVRLKIQQHPRLQLLLAGTGRALLYDPALPDFWEWEPEVEAVRSNLIGTLLMELRKEYL